MWLAAPSSPNGAGTGSCTANAGSAKVSLVGWLVAAIPVFFMSRKTSIRFAQAWGRFNLRLLEAIVGMKVEFRGLERVPPGGLLLVSKHQSLLETFALLPCVDDPTFILKRELRWIPFFGWVTAKTGMIPVQRGGKSALIEVNRRAQVEVARGRQIIIFPEGTRRAPGAPPAYRQGVVHLYRSLGVTCIPVALNSGLFWPRRQYIRRPGTVVIEFLDPIPPGLDRDLFMSTVEERIETASNRLLAEAGRPAGYSGPEGI